MSPGRAAPVRPKKRGGFHPRQIVYVLGIVVLALVTRDVFFPSGFTRTRCMSAQVTFCA